MFKLSKPYVGRHAYGKTVDSSYLPTFSKCGASQMPFANWSIRKSDEEWYLGDLRMG